MLVYDTIKEQLKIQKIFIESKKDCQYCNVSLSIEKKIEKISKNKELIGCQFCVIEIFNYVSKIKKGEK